MSALLSILLFLLPQAPQEDPSTLQAVFDTSAGQFVMEFYPNEAPNHVRKFIELARQGFYNGTAFHSVVAHGVVQGGDPETKNPNAKDKYGTGGFNMGLKQEISKIPFSQGTVVSTILPDKPDSAGSEFFICVTDQLQLTGQFSAFGHIVQGIEVVDKISTTPTDDNQITKERVELRNVTVRKIPPPTPPPFSTETVDELRNYQVVMDTSKGKIVIDLFPDKAPNTVRHFLRLTSVGVYDQTAFHRIAPDFVIQAGDLNTRKEPVSAEAHKYVVNIAAEINDVKHQPGIVSMARGDALDSALTSFFIVLADHPDLDGTYTVFGKVVEGMDVVEKIGAVPQDNEKPLQRVDIYSMKVRKK